MKILFDFNFYLIALPMVLAEEQIFEKFEHMNIAKYNTTVNVTHRFKILINLGTCLNSALIMKLNFASN